MDVLVKLLVAIVLGAVVAWAFSLIPFLANWLATLIGIVVGFVYFFSDRSWPRR